MTMDQRVLRPPDEGVVFPSLRVGAGSGAAGLLFGALVGTIRSSTPILWATVTGIQWSLLGGTYWAFRSAITRFQLTSEHDELSLSTKANISAASGAASAALVGGVTRGRANILPGTIMGSLAGYIGQRGYSLLDARNTQQIIGASRPEGSREPYWKRLMQSKYSPVKHLSHEEYKKVLEDKLLRVDAEIAVIEDDIREIRRQQVAGEVRDVASPSENEESER